AVECGRESPVKQRALCSDVDVVPALQVRDDLRERGPLEDETAGRPREERIDIHAGLDVNAVVLHGCQLTASQHGALECVGCRHDGDAAGSDDDLCGAAAGVCGHVELRAEHAYRRLTRPDGEWSRRIVCDLEVRATAEHHPALGVVELHWNPQRAAGREHHTTAILERHGDPLAALGHDL